MDQKQEEKFDSKLVVALTVYIASIFASNTLGVKLMPFLFGGQLSVSVFFFPFVFLMTDVIGEVYGKKMARRFILAGFLSILLFLIFSLISTIMPWGERALWIKGSYNQVFGISARIAIASLIAFIIAEYQDVIAFFFFRRKLGTKNFWLRSNLSNIWSQLLDTSIFMTIAFLGIYPPKVLLLLIIPWWLYKVVMGALYTPLSYLGLRLLRGKPSTNPTPAKTGI
ncbi:MAG: queuosine precursor transporter [Patescibacteria group bacterium]